VNPLHHDGEPLAVPVQARNALHMDVTLGAVLAIVGVLLGQVAAHLFSRRSAAAANDWARSERLHQERIAAYAALAGSLATYRRGMLDRAFAKVQAPRDPAYEDLLRESRRSRDSAQQALYLVELLCDRPEVVRAARVAYYSMDEFVEINGREEIDAARNLTRATIQRFVSTARDTISPVPAEGAESGPAV
jgi:hypothetical protein